MVWEVLRRGRVRTIQHKRPLVRSMRAGCCGSDEVCRVGCGGVSGMFTQTL